MLNSDSNLYLSKSFNPNKFMSEAEMRENYYPSEFRWNSFDLDFDCLDTKNLDMITMNLNDNELFFKEDSVTECLSMKFDSNLSDLRSLSDCNELADQNDNFDDEDFSIQNKEQILDNCPNFFKNTVEDFNYTLNCTLKTQFDQVHTLLEKMSWILIKREPKKTKFIIDCRLGNKIKLKGSKRRISKKDESNH